MLFNFQNFNIIHEQGIFNNTKLAAAIFHVKLTVTFSYLIRVYFVNPETKSNDTI